MGQIQGTCSSSRPATPAHTNILPQRALEDEMNRLLMSSLASNTTKAYAVGLQAFDQFRLNQQLSILWPPPSNHILMSIAHLSIQGCKQTTARAYTSAIAFKCKVLGNGYPTKHLQNTNPLSVLISSGKSPTSFGNQQQVLQISFIQDRGSYHAGTAGHIRTIHTSLWAMAFTSL